MDIQSDETMEKILQNAKDDADSMFDEKARAQYLMAVSKIYESRVREKELDNAVEDRKIEKKKIASETASKIIDSGLRFVGTLITAGAGTYVFLKSWDEGMRFEQTGIYTSSSFKDLKRSIKLPKIW